MVRMRAPQRDVERLHAVRVAGAVEPFVVRLDQRRLRGQLGGRRHDLRADGRVLVHEDPLALVERPLLEQDVVADADLADVVQQPGPLDLLDLGLRQAHHPAHRLGDVAHPARVVAGVGVPGVDRLRERLDRLLEQLPRLDVPRVRQAGREERDHEERRRPPADPVRQLEDLRHEPRERDQADRGWSRRRRCPAPIRSGRRRPSGR